MQLGADVAGHLDDPPFDGGVHVLVALGEREPSALQLVTDLVQGAEQRLPLVGREDAGPLKPADVRPGAGEVVARQADVEGQALGECHHLIGGRHPEPLLPRAHRGGWGRRGWRAAHVSSPSPHRRTKPAASSWRNASAAS